MERCTCHCHSVVKLTRPISRSFLHTQRLTASPAGQDTSVRVRRRGRRLLLTVVSSVGLGVIAYTGYRKMTCTSDPCLANNAEVTLYRKVPLKAMSRAWGAFNEMDLPVFLRKPLLGLYVWMFGVNMSEAQDPELRNYRNLSEFFRRTLKPGARQVDTYAPLTCPSDGTILHYGKVENGVVEQVKGVNYSLKSFLGSPSWNPDSGEPSGPVSDKEYQESLKIQPGNALHHCIIYLAPGDYHRFHSSANWHVTYRRHFPGELLSVNPGVARWIQGLFSFNERVVYAGSWKYGFFSYTPVGATNVGSMKIYVDEELKTNNKTAKCPEGAHFDKRLSSADNSGIPVKKGEMFGEFNLGSTIVLIFEAPENFEFTVQDGQKVQFGQTLGLVDELD